MNYIERDVYVLENRIKEKIDYVRGTNALPIYFHFRDYEIPEDVKSMAPHVLSHRISQGSQSAASAAKFLHRILEQVQVPLESL